MPKVERRTVDLTAHPDLVVVYLGMGVNRLRGIKTVLGFGPRIQAAAEHQPDGLLLHETLFYSLRHIGIREYWRDFESLERWTRAPPHSDWWREFLRDSGGTGFWHELYFRRSGMGAVYDDMPPTGLGRVVRRIPARGPLFSSRQRLQLGGESPSAPPVPEDETLD